MNISEKLRTIRKEKGLTQVALCEKLGIPKSLYNKYEVRGVRPSYENLLKIADFYGIPLESLLVDDDNTSSIVNTYKNTYVLEPYTKLPVMGIIRAGQPICTDQGDYETEYADAQYGDGNHFMLKVQGDSMAPTIPNGSLAIIRKQDNAESGDVVAFALEGEYATLKRYYPQPDGSIILKGDNPQAFTYNITPEQLENGEAHILGICRSYKVNL